MQLERGQLVFAFKAAALGFAVALIYVVVAQRWPQSPRTVEIVHASREASAGSDADGRYGQTSYAAAVAAAAPSVVNIYTASQTRPASGFDSPLFEQLFGDRSGTGKAHNIRTGAGSGVIVSSAGYIVTNNHLIADTDEINVMLKTGESYPAHVIGTDPETDLAVIRIDARGLPAIALAAQDSLRVGDVVLAIGNPLGAGQTVTMGIVSATRRDSVGLHTFEDFIQTDAAINPGNSGGALINPNGELVGVNTAIFTQTDGARAGLGLATPVHQVQTVVEQIIQHGRVIRGWLGVVARDLSPALRRELDLPLRGVVVTGVIERGPAERAGIRAGDVITEVDEQKIIDSRTLLTLTTMGTPGSEVVVEGLREREPFATRVTLTQRPLPQTIR